MPGAHTRMVCAWRSFLLPAHPPPTGVALTHSACSCTPLHHRCQAFTWVTARPLPAPDPKSPPPTLSGRCPIKCNIHPHTHTPDHLPPTHLPTYHQHQVTSTQRLMPQQQNTASLMMHHTGPMAGHHPLIRDHTAAAPTHLGLPQHPALLGGGRTQSKAVSWKHMQAQDAVLDLIFAAESLNYSDRGPPPFTAFSAA